MKILVVDDDATIRELAEELLTSAGYNVLTARDGEEALRLVYDERPDLILLDLIMPKMNGFQFVREIRNDPRLNETPILIMSALVSGSHTAYFIHDLDVVGFIDKTECVISLVPRVQEILSKQAHQVA